VDRWRIYYGDWTTFSDRDGTPFSAPQTNVQGIVKETPGGPAPFKITKGKDAYYWSSIDGWIGCDTMGMWDYLMQYKGPKAVLFGRTIRDEKFWEIDRRAKAEGLG
jgi:hypothetical protein